MYRKERNRLLAQIAALKAKPATRKEIEACEIDFHILETNHLQKIGNRYFDFDSQVGPWQTDAVLPRRWLLPPQRLDAGKKIRAAKKLWVKEWIEILNCSISEVTQRAEAAGLVSRGSKKPISKSNIHRLLRKRFYTGYFDWNGKTYKGSHEPLISIEHFDRVQEILDGRFITKQRVSRQQFAFSGLVSCGHCGCALVAERKKGKYVYYHCTGNKGKCAEPYAREEVLEECFADLLKGLIFDDEVMDWIVEALHQSHSDEKRTRQEAIARLRVEQTKLQNRLDRLYEDRLDGFIEPAFFERKTREWKHTQARLIEQIAQHEAANLDYFADGVRLLELSTKAYFLFKEQKPHEKRRLLNFVCSNSTWKDRTLTATFRQPFDILAVTNTAWQKQKVAGACSGDLRPIWLRR